MVNYRKDLFVDLAKVLVSTGDQKTDVDNNFTGYELSEVFIAADKTDKIIPLGVLFKAFDLNFVLLPKGTMAMVEEDTNETFLINDEELVETLHHFLEWRLSSIKNHSF